MKRTIQTRTSGRSNRCGAASVEFALVIPVFLSIVFFFLETWRFQQVQQTVDQAALEAARAAIIPGATADDARARGNKILQAVSATAATVTVAPDPINQSTDQVTVTVEMSNANVGLFFKYFSSDYVFRSSLTLSTENKRIGRL